MRKETNNRVAAFISIPKNASKTVLRVLELGHNRDREVTNSLVIFENHQRGIILNERFDLDPLFVFCFCRNPYDRCVSWFEYHKELPLYQPYTFETWIKDGMPHHWVKQNYTDYVREGISPLLQYHYVDRCRVDYIGRMENFQHDFQTIIDKLNAQCEQKGLSHRFQYRTEKINISERGDDYEKYYTSETKNIVYELLAKDFSYFGYSK